MKDALLEKKSVQARKEHPHRLIRRIQQGLRYRELEHLQNGVDLPLDELAEKLAISRSTLQRRRATGRLTAQESDRVIRFSRLLRLAADLFGSVERGRAWLKYPQRGLGGAVPLDYARTEVGAQEVERLLGRIQYSVYT
jgi:putative toxin-antitoxin system antitoxin component (TIGR02293 family)